MDARYNRTILIHHIEEIAKYRKQIVIYNKDIRSFIDNIIPCYPTSSFVYFDPLYYVNGQRLYKNALSLSDHSKIASSIINGVECQWIITYDDVLELRKIYAEFPQAVYTLNYSAANKGKGSELMIFKSAELIPASKEIYACMPDFHLSKI